MQRLSASGQPLSPLSNNQHRGRTGIRVLVRAELGEQLGQLVLGRDVNTGIRWAPLFHVRMTALVELDPLANAANR